MASGPKAPKPFGPPPLRREFTAPGAAGAPSTFLTFENPKEEPMTETRTAFGPDALRRALLGERMTVNKAQLAELFAAATPEEATALRQRVSSNDVYVEDR